MDSEPVVTTFTTPYLTAVIVVLTAIMLLILISFAANTDSGFHKDAKEEIKKLIKDEYTVESKDDSFVFALNALMLAYTCCGVDGAHDFGNLTFIEKPLGSADIDFQFQVPPACCVRDIFNDERTDRFIALKKCAVDGLSKIEMVNAMGCYNKIFGTLQNLSTAFLAIILTWDVLVLVLAIMTIMDIRQQEAPRPIRPSAVIMERKSITLKEKQRPPLPVVKKFIPYAKISSFSHPDINRVKSTEIW